MTIEVHNKISSCNLAKTVHNKWLQGSNNKMICLYEAIVDNMVCTYMQIDDYRAWLQGGSNGKGHDSTYLKLEAATNCGDPKMLANAIRSYLGVEGVNIMA